MKRSADTDSVRKAPAAVDQGSTDEGFLHRWARRKAQATTVGDEAPPQPGSELAPGAGEVPVKAPVEPEARTLTDADMPPLDSLNEDSDYSPFLSPGVSEGLRKQALRKLFRSASFNELCPLEGEYHDCRDYEPLGSIVTHEMRAQLEREARELADRAQAALEETVEPTPVKTSPRAKSSMTAEVHSANQPSAPRRTAARKAAKPSRESGRHKRREKC